MTTINPGNISRLDLRRRLEATDDPEARERVKMYPSPGGIPSAVVLQDRPAAEVMDSFAGQTYGAIESEVRKHHASSEAAMRVSMGTGLGLAGLGVGSLVAHASGMVPGPVGAVLGGLSMVGAVMAFFRFETHEDAARDDVRLLGEMAKAGEAILADTRQAPPAA